MTISFWMLFAIAYAACFVVGLCMGDDIGGGMIVATVGVPICAGLLYGLIYLLGAVGAIGWAHG